MAKKKKHDDELSKQSPLEENEPSVSIEDAVTSEQPKKKEKKVSRKSKKAAKKKAAKEAEKIITSGEAEADALKDKNTAEAEEPKQVEESKKAEESKQPKKEKKTEKPEPVDETDAAEKAEKSKKPKKEKKTEKPEPAEKTDAAENTGKSAKAEKPKTSKKSDKAEKSKAEEKLLETEETEEPKKAEEPKKTEEPKKAEKSKQPKKEKKTEKPEPVDETDASEKTEKPEKAEKPKTSKKSDKVEKPKAEKKALETEEIEEPKKEKQSEKPKKDVDNLLAVEIDSEKKLTLNEAFANIENQLKEIEKGDSETAKSRGRRGKKEAAAEERTEELSISKSDDKNNLSLNLESTTSKKESAEEKKGFIKEFTIQLNGKGSLKEESLDKELVDQTEFIFDSKNVSPIPKEIFIDNVEELTLFDKETKSSVKKSARKKSDTPLSGEKNENVEETAKALPSLGKLQDIKGEKIDDFIEQVEYSPEKVSEPETADSHIKPLPRILSHFVPVQGDGVGEIVRKGFVVICIVLLLVSLGILIDSTHGDDNDSDKTDNVLSNYSTNFAINNADSTLPDGVLEKYYALYNVNNDMVGWLTLPGTPIDMPVVQYSDNEFYETTDFNGNDLVGLVAYADTNSPMKTLSRKTVLYVSSGDGYGNISGLDAYEDLKSIDSVNESMTLSFGTLYDDYEWKIIAGILTKDVKNTVSELSVEDFSKFSEYLLKETVYSDSLVNIKSGEKILMLCIPHSTSNSTLKTNDSEYLVLVARLLNNDND